MWKGQGTISSPRCPVQVLVPVRERESHAEAEVEETCPQLLKGEPGSAEAVEARLDVHFWAAGEQLFEEWVGGTVTHPWSLTRRKAAAKKDGAAVEKAECSKLTRYGSGSGGVTVAPAGFETWGRLGDSCRSVLARLAAQCCAHGARSGPPHRVLRRWLAELGVAQQRAMAETLAQASRAQLPPDAACDESEEGGLSE